MSDTAPTAAFLVFDWFGEKKPDFFLIPDPPNWLPGVHGYFLGAVNEEGVDDLIENVCAAVSEEWDGEHEMTGAWLKYKVGEGFVTPPGGAKIVWTGVVP